MTPEQIQEKLDKFFGLCSFMEFRGKRRTLSYMSPSFNIELFRVELFESDTEGWTLGSITHSLSSQLEHLNNVVGA